GAIGITIKETPDFVLEFLDAFDGSGYQSPCQVLTRQPLAPINGVHKMAFNRITFGQCDVVATLHHTCTAAFTDESFNRDGDIQTRISLLGVQPCKKACTARPKDEYVCF